MGDRSCAMGGAFQAEALVGWGFWDSGIPGFWILDSGFWILGSGILGSWDEAQPARVSAAFPAFYK
jgi:hypothetical protein